VPSVYSVRVAKFELAMISLYHSDYDIHLFPHAALYYEVPPRTGFGESRPPSSTRCYPKECQKAPLDEPRPNLVGHPVAGLARLAEVVNRRPTGHRRSMAQTRIPTVLEMEEPTEMAGTTKGSRGNP
jgi:hypothetical protein